MGGFSSSISHNFSLEGPIFNDLITFQLTMSSFTWYAQHKNNTQAITWISIHGTIRPNLRFLIEVYHVKGLVCKLSDCRMTRTSCLLYLCTHSDCRMTRTFCLLYLYTHTDCRMTRTSCLLYLCTHSDCRMTRTSCLLYLYAHSDCRMTRTSCLLYLCTHSDCISVMN